MQHTRKHDSAPTEPESVSEFTEWLAGLDLADWLLVASAAEQGTRARSTALVLVEALIGHLGLSVQAWSILDDVATVSHHDDSQSFPLTASRLTERLRLAREAANAAALALLVRRSLDGEDFDVLYHPFSVLAPA
jgi:hypothetical protein